MRIACIVVPLFVLAARLRSEPELEGEVLVIAEGNGGAARVVAATRRARAAGIRRGLTLAQARAILPGLIARGRDPDCERSAQAALVEVARTLSPRVEDAGEGVTYLDVTGLERHHPSEGAFAVTAARTVKRAVGLEPRVGVAAGKRVARVAAETPGGPHVVAEGEGAAFLAALPVRRLRPSEELAERLASWGIRTIGELAQLDARSVSRRLGRAGSELHRAAVGSDPDPLVPAPPPPRFREGMELEWPIVALEPFQFVARAALDRLAARLELASLACARLELELGLDPTGHDARTIGLPAPTREVKTLLELMRLELEARPPAAPIASFALIAAPGRAPRVQATLFGPPELSPEKLALTVARLAARIGPDRVGSPGVVADHRPGGFVVREYAPPPVRGIPGDDPFRARGLLAMRVLRPPIELEAEVEERGALVVPVRLATRERARPVLDGRVRVASGPFHLEGEWWGEKPFDREYWDVELTDGGLFRVFRDRRADGWFADGAYD